MFKNTIAYLMALLFSYTSIGYAQPLEIAITLDDLPFVGSANNNPNNLKREEERFMKIMQTLIDEQVPATGFVIAGSIEKGQWKLLEDFYHAGFTLGNHTYSHMCLNSSNIEKYIENVAHADKILSPLLSTPKYFRFPYLAEGHGETKTRIQQYLTEQGYVIAPVTIDSKDFQFNEQLYHIAYRARPAALPAMKKRYLDYIWNQTLRAEKRANGKPVKQILLLHANLLNSHFLGDVIALYKAHGYKFITLAQALEGAAPSITETTEKPTAPETPTQSTEPVALSAPFLDNWPFDSF
ncbi:MAG: polysaccharide deacetylase family protein [Legionellaceae bacterium]